MAIFNSYVKLPEGILLGPISLGGLIHHGAVRNLAPPVDPPGIGVHLLFRNAPAQEWGDGHGEEVVICTPCMV
jgi:hypothetical protein